MNITFLIGNGFDLNAGLWTQYRQFLKFYCSPECQHTYAAQYTRPLDSGSAMGTIKVFVDLLQRDLEYWSDFEAALGDSTNMPPLNRQNTFDLCLADFEMEFNEYLKQELARFDWKQSLPAATEHFRNNVMDHMNMLRPAFTDRLLAGFGDKVKQDRHYRFITFNYTNTLDRILEPLLNVPHTSNKLHVTQRFYQAVHVHGKIDAGMIMGVNDESQIANDALASQPLFHSSIVKPVVNQQYGSGADNAAKELIDSSDEICILGMSIGKTDACWWQLIGQWLLTDASHQVVLFNRGTGLLPLHPQFFHPQETALKDRFLAQCFPENITLQKNVASQVFAALQTPIFSGITLRERQLPSKSRPLYLR